MNDPSQLVSHLITHGILLKAKLVGEIQEDIFNFLHGHWDLAFGGPSRIWLLGTRYIGKRIKSSGTSAHMRLDRAAVMTSITDIFIACSR